MEVKFISGFVIPTMIAEDFNLEEENPRTYLKFLELKLYSSQYTKIEFSHKEEGNLVFVATAEWSSGTYQIEYYIDPRLPDKVVKKGESKLIKPKESPESRPTPTNHLTHTPAPGFKDVEEKKSYVLDALMKNIYLYRLLHLDSLPERMNLDTSIWHLREGPSDFDRLIPNYDEYLGIFKLVEGGCCYGKSGCSERCFYAEKRAQFPVYEPLPHPLNLNYKRVVGERRIYPQVQFYRFYTIGKESLIRRESKYTRQASGPGEEWCPVGNLLEDGDRRWYRYDFYYHPEYRQSLKRYEVKRYKVQGDTCYYPPPPSFPISVRNLNTYPDYAYPEANSNYYLVALDTFTRQVYFVSGEEIYLSRVVNLYSPGDNPHQMDPDRKWAQPEQLLYLQDRLYQYRVDDLTEEHIIFNDEEKIVLKVQGLEDGRPLPLRVTMYKARPEMLEVERL
jgi:hypothetical protein